MKKVLAICLVMVMAFCMSVTAFAAPNGFVSSPSSNSAPTVDEFKPADEDCSADLVVTPFSDLSDLPEDLQQIFRKAFDSIVSAEDLTKLNKQLEKVAKEKGIDPEDLAISDLFNLSCEGCDDHDGHDQADITLDAETLSNFIGLMFMDKNGEWQWVENANVTADGKLKFTATNTSAPYAIVVDNTKTGTIGGSGDPGTGEGFGIYFWIAIASTAALLIVFVLILIKKKRA